MMKTSEAKKITVKIMAVILEELNGYTKADAVRLAPDNEGHPVYERTLALLVRNVPKQEPVKCHHDFKYMDDYKIYVCLSCGHESKKGNISLK